MGKETIKRKELFTLIGVLLGFVILLTVASFYFRDRQVSKKDEAKEEIQVVEGTISQQTADPEAEPGKTSETIGSTAFFIKPSAAEMLTALRESDPYAPQQLPEDSPPLKVMWPGYFFSFEQQDDGTAIVQLDVDETGFGVILICTLNPTDFPEIQKLEQGKKVWVAGIVTSIDMEGTGTVHIDAEHIRYEESLIEAIKPGPLKPAE